MAWTKLGMVFDLSKHRIDWLKSHAMIPTPLLLGDLIRVYFAGRDEKGRSRIGFVDLKEDDPTRVVHVHKSYVMELGKLGTCDDSGTLCTCAVAHGKDIYLYYTTYNIRVTVPYSNAIGLAVSRDGGTSFERMFDGPILDRNHLEPYFTISPWVLREGAVWHMWYGSGTGWILVNDAPESLYHIKYASSEDGVLWRRDNISCIRPLVPDEANCRPTVLKEGKGYKMWFSFRGSSDFRDGAGSYRIGYAEARDPTHWIRDDSKAGMALGPEDWDSKMQAYPAVIDTGKHRFLFYNGNGFGAAGFGCAVWE